MIPMTGKGREKKGEEGEEKCYSAHTYYIPQVSTTSLMHFTIVCDLELCLKDCSVLMFSLHDFHPLPNF